MLSFIITFVTFATSMAYGAPTGARRRSDDGSRVSAADLAGFTPFTQFAAAAYCPVDKLKTWSCGSACDALADFTPTLVGGNGNEIQQFIVGYWETNNSVVVAHEGTDPTKFASVLTDIDLLRDPLDPELFPGVADNVYVHGGFQDQHALTAVTILEEVKSLFAAHNTSNLVLVGHSLGAALATLDSLYFSLQLPEANIVTRTYGLPRVGNTAFVDLLQGRVTDFKRINNRQDFVPTIPSQDLGFMHPSDEVHIVRDGDAENCTGNENDTDENCTLKNVPNLLAGNILDHLGPYEGVYIGTIFCN